MYRVLTCLAYEHDLRIVGVAVILCILSSYVALKLLHRAQDVKGKARLIWLVTGGGVGGFGIWATHFVAMLAYDPGIPVGYQLPLTLGSLGVAMLSTSAALALAAYIQGRLGAMAGAIIFGAGVSSMHFMGMNAIEFSGRISWDTGLVAASLIFSILFALPAFYLLSISNRRSSTIFVASLMLALSIVSLHFTAMGAVTAIPDPTEEMSENILSPVVLVVTIAAVAFSLLLSGLTAAVFAMQAEATAAAGEEKFRLLVQGVTDYALYMLDPDGYVTNWNTGAQRAKGYGAAEIIGKHYSCFYTPADRAASIPEKNLRIATETGKFEAEGWRLRKDGSRMWAHVVIDAIKDEHGQLIGFAKITRDCTEQMLAAARLKKTSDNLALALEHMANALCLFGEDGRLIMYNRRLSELLDIAPTIDLHGKTLEDLCLFNPANAHDRIARYKSLIGNGTGEVTTQLPSGRIIRTTYSPTNSRAWVMTLEDVTARVQSEQRISHMARHDALTGLPNRRQFMEGIEAAMRTADATDTKVAVINIDLDRFKEINDTHGHSVGDEALCALSSRMRAGMQKGEMIGRFGGDEFVALKPFRRKEELDEFLTRLLTALTGTVQLDHVEVQPGASLGAAIYPTDATEAEKLLSNADMAMYRAKENLEEKICFYDASMDEVARGRRALAKDIWTGIRENQFFLHYQVQQAAITGTITGYEVLLRWNHPEQGMIPPNIFIPLAEECGAISALGEWVLERACNDAANWPVKEKIAVNLSPLQLSNSRLPDRVQEILTESGLSPERLELEVTESAFISDKTRALHILRQIKNLGVTIAIDDFGTGFSSLETLRAFPFDKIKLDRSFIFDLDRSRQARAFVRAILALGKSLEIPILAEGVETESQMVVLTQEGCNQFQGYYFGRPNTLEKVMGRDVGNEDARPTSPRASA
ncbi:bifunctional diguanylate cyclase/phosphodiesterase [Niveispirillum irakense]|uniref:bifunctional diguanylate cyclase/phosphodiesterase n=1 Tax=Niveispirillum irakense TaxID=34011 RepID=UPI00041B383F|nr:EAL domain-containing protein [Niveispirillum irakense]